MKEQLERDQIIHLSGTDNTRDLGGLQTADHHVVRRGRLIRSDHLNRLTEKDCTILSEQYKVKVVVDLRRESESKRQPDQAIAGAVLVHDPLVPEIARAKTFAQISGVGELMLESVHHMNDDVLAYQTKRYAEAALSDFTAEAIQKWVALLLDTEDGAVLWHCTAGKDRTGVLAALILLILGVPIETVKANYLLTNQIIRQKIQWIVDKTRDVTTDPNLLKQVELLCSVHGNYFDAVISAIESHYDSLSKYVRHHLHISDEMIAALQNSYLISRR